MIYYVTAILFLVLIYTVAVVLPKYLDKQGRFLDAAVKGLIDDYFISHTEGDLEKKRLRLHKLTISTDRVLSQVLLHFACNDSSVNQQLRTALNKGIITYDQFRILKQFHHMRNEVVHEDLQVYGDNEQVVYSALVIMKTILG